MTRFEYIAFLQRKIERLKKHIVLIAAVFPHSTKVAKLETKRAALRNMQLLLLEQLEAEHAELFKKVA
jgi:hypothetical protein